MGNQMLIAGKWTDGRGDGTIAVTSPVDGASLGEVRIASSEDVDEAVRGARAAVEQLDRMTVFERAERLHRVAEMMRARKEELARELTTEQGKPYRAEALDEIEESAENFEVAAEDIKRLNTEVLPSTDRNKRMFTLRKPNGVYGTITPWNFPFVIPSELLAPGLAAGNAMILKPSEHTPLIGARMAEIIAEAGFPDGAISLVFGEAETGQALVTHPGVDAIAFVGHNETAEAIVRAAGLKRTLIEASGNGPVIVLDDANLDEAAELATFGATYVSGQCCVATERILVAEGVHDAFLERLIKDAEAAVLGDPFDDDTVMGPLNNAAVAEKMDRHLEDARKQGVAILTGGRRAEGFPTDLYYELTVADGVRPETLLFREETFGPVLPVTTFGDDEEAIALANASELGLQAAVFTSSLKRAFRFVDRIRSGNIVVNDTTDYWEAHQPFGGASSTKTGWGRVGGKYAIEDMSDLRTVIIDWEKTRD